jgi:hypothetical protein
MARFRLFHRLRNRRSGQGDSPAALPTMLKYPRGHAIKREVLSSVCCGHVRVLRLHRSGQAEVVSMLYDEWIARGIGAVERDRAVVIRVPANMLLQSVNADASVETAALDGV